MLGWIIKSIIYQLCYETAYNSKKEFLELYRTIFSKNLVTPNHHRAIIQFPATLSYYTHKWCTHTHWTPPPLHSLGFDQETVLFVWVSSAAMQWLHFLAFTAAGRRACGSRGPMRKGGWGRLNTVREEVIVWWKCKLHRTESTCNLSILALCGCLVFVMNVT